HGDGKQHEAEQEAAGENGHRLGVRFPVHHVHAGHADRFKKTRQHQHDPRHQASPPRFPSAPPPGSGSAGGPDPSWSPAVPRSPSADRSRSLSAADAAGSRAFPVTVLRPMTPARSSAISSIFTRRKGSPNTTISTSTVPSVPRPVNAA